MEVEGASAQAEGYGAGAGLVWRRNGLAAHLTGLASLYELEVQTFAAYARRSDFSAFSTLLSTGFDSGYPLASGLVLRSSAGLTWQSLALDEAAEYGGIAAAFERAERLTARLAIGLEAKQQPGGRLACRPVVCRSGFCP